MLSARDNQREWFLGTGMTARNAGRGCRGIGHTFYDYRKVALCSHPPEAFCSSGGDSYETEYAHMWDAELHMLGVTGEFPAIMNGLRL